VNFKKNEKTYQPTNSEVLKMVQEIDSEPKTPEPEPSVGGIISSPPTTGLRHVSAPETKPAPTTPHEDPFKVLPPGQNICADCERLIVGVFVRIKDKNLHVECFKCATCGTSLKNVGYYNINNKLYCDIHAKLVARQNPPAPNLEPITVPPGGRAPAGAISAALGKPGTLGPLPFHAPRGGTTHVNAPRPVQGFPSSFAGPKPFSTPSAPTTSPARPAPASIPVKSVPAPIPVKSVPVAAPAPAPIYAPPPEPAFTPILAPPPGVAPPISSPEPNPIPTEESDESPLQNAAFHKKYSMCSQEVLAINKDKPEPVQRPESPTPMQGSKTSSIQDLPSTAAEQPPQQLEEQVKTVATETTPAQEPEPIPLPVETVVSEPIIPEVPEPKTKVEFSEMTSSSQVTVEEKQAHSQLTSALTIASERPFSPLPSTGILSQSEIISSKSEQTVVSESSSQFQQHTPINPNPFPIQSPPQAANPAFPKPFVPAMVSALTIAPERPYSPLPSATVPTLPASVPSAPVSTQAPSKPVAPAPVPLPVSFQSLQALAPDRPYSPLPSATKSMISASQQSAPITTPAVLPSSGLPSAPAPKPSAGFKPMTPAQAPAPLPLPPSAGFKPMTPAQAPAPLPVPQTIPTLKPVIPAPLATSTQGQAPFDREVPAPTSTKPVQPQTKSASSSSLPVIGGFRPIIAPNTSEGFKPIQTEKTPVMPPSAQFRPEQLPQPARPETPVQRVMTPTPRSRSATPHQLSTRTGLQKPAAIPYYQQEMGEYPAQSQVPQAVPQQQSSYPFPNIPFPEGFKAETPIFKPSPQPASAGPTFKPSPLAAPQPASTAPIFKPSPLAAPQPASTAPVYKPSPLAAPQPASTVPAFKPSPLGASQPASTAPVFKPSPLAAPQPASIAPAFKQSPLVAPQPVSKPAQVPAVATQPSSFAKTPSVPSSSSIPNAGGGGGAPGGGQKGATIAGSTAPRRGKGVLTQQSAGGRIPLCAHCNSQIRGPFITALGKNWCPEHFVCVNAQCRRPLADIGFVEEKGELYCEYCFEKYLAPTCDKCSKKVKG
ncbi:hypothetical protein L9F63_002381, partial [Diploptera punctata]